MIRFIDVTEKTFNMVFDKMTTAFPYEERRDYSDQKECLKNQHFEFLEIYDGDTAVGFTALWIFDNFIFIEHIAIDEDKRGGGYGSKAIELLKEKHQKPLILEAEAPITEQQIKRIKFYDRLGFNVNVFDYTQPSYHGSEGVPLLVLSYPNMLSDNEFNEFLKETRREVYRILPSN